MVKIRAVLISLVLSLSAAPAWGQACHGKKYADCCISAVVNPEG